MQQASQRERVHNTNDGLLTLLAASERGTTCTVSYSRWGGGQFGFWTCTDMWRSCGSWPILW